MANFFPVNKKIVFGKTSSFILRSDEQSIFARSQQNLIAHFSFFSDEMENLLKFSVKGW